MTRETVHAFPWLAAIPPTEPGNEQPGFAKVQEYLRRFGYLEDRPELAIGTLDDPTSEALRSFQRFFGLPETGAFDEATREAMMRPRCALPDRPARDVGFATTCAWDHTNLTYALDVGTGDVAGDAEWNAIRNAFATWQALGSLTFTEVGTGDNPDIRVGWRPANDADFSMVGGTLAHADFPPDCGVVTDTLPKPVHFDDTEHVWTVGAASNAFDVETVALHEVGHIVGLAHSSVADAVMLPTVSSNSTKRALTQDDIDGFHELYPPALGPWSGWASRGGVVTSKIVVARNADGRLEIFARGTDGAVWHQWQTAPNNGWSGWSSLGGVISSEIAVANNADGRLEVFARGTDNAVWHIWQTAPNNGWSGWASLGGVITSNIAVAANADGRLEFFARGTDNAVWHQWQTAPNNGWSGWATLGGVITSQITVTNNADGRLEIFVRGTDNAVWHQWQTAPSNGWSGWATLGGTITTNIAVGRNAGGRLEFFARGADNALWHQWQTAPNNGWSGWASLGGIITTDPSVGSNADGRLEVFARGADNAVWHQWQTQPFLTGDGVTTREGMPVMERAAAPAYARAGGSGMPAGDMASADTASRSPMPAGAMSPAGGGATAGMPATKATRPDEGTEARDGATATA